MSAPLSGRTALVTGGASGIGAAVCEALVARGARVAVVDLDGTAAGATTERLGGAGNRGYACDVGDPQAVATTVDAVVADLGGIDLLVNSAGVVLLDPAEELSTRTWDTTLRVNTTGTFLVCQAVGRTMLAAGHGRIVNLASQAATVALDQHVAYCASKFAVVGLSKVLASEWAGRGITVNTVSPTVVMTELGRRAWAGAKGEALKALIPTGRFAEPEEVAAAVLFLLSDDAAMINGVDLLVDGGFTIR